MWTCIGQVDGGGGGVLRWTESSGGRGSVARRCLCVLVERRGDCGLLEVSHAGEVGVSRAAVGGLVARSVEGEVVLAPGAWSRGGGRRLAALGGCRWWPSAHGVDG